MHFQQKAATTIYCSNNSDIKLSKNPVLHEKIKHIDERFHFLRKFTRDEIIDFLYCKSEDQIADIMTKPLKLSTFKKLKKMLGVCAIDKSYYTDGLKNFQFKGEIVKNYLLLLVNHFCLFCST